MKYLSASEVANEWGVSSAQIRKYCREGRIPGAFTENNAWYVPETAVKPTRKEAAEQEKEVLFPVAKVLRRQMKKKNFHGLYDYVQINFAYSSGRLASVRLTRQCTSDMYFKSKVKVGFEPLKVSDLIETLNHFDAMEYILKSINKPLTEKFIKEIHWRLTQGTVDERNKRVFPGEYRSLQTKQDWHESMTVAEISNRLKHVGETLKFPTTTEEVQALLKRIGVDGVRYEEIFITSFDSDVLGLHEHLGEYENIDELNYLAALLSDMDQSDLEKIEAVIDAGEYTGSVKDLINLTQNLDCFEFYSGIHSEEDLGRMYILDFEAMTVPEHLIDYIDYEAYGRDVRINDGGHFAPGGYVADNHSSFVELYTGRDDIPDEYRVFSMPRLSIPEQMAAFKDVIDRSSLEGERKLPKPGREDR